MIRRRSIPRTLEVHETSRGWDWESTIPGAEVEHIDFTPLNGQQFFVGSDWSSSRDAVPARSMHMIDTYGHDSKDLLKYMYMSVSHDAVSPTLADTKPSPKTKDTDNELVNTHLQHIG